MLETMPEETLICFIGDAINTATRPVDLILPLHPTMEYTIIYHCSNFDTLGYN